MPSTLLKVVFFSIQTMLEPLKYIGYKFVGIYTAFLFITQLFIDLGLFHCKVVAFHTEWHKYSLILSMSSFFIGAVMCINRLVLSQLPNKSLGIATAYHGSLSLMIISIISLLLNDVLTNQSYYCIDYLG